MRALLSNSPGGPESLTLGTLPDPIPGDDEIVVQVEACSVNFPDSLIIADQYQYKPARPFAPGAEVAGTVLEAGQNVAGFVPGDRVMAMCGWGGMAERISIPVNACCLMPTSKIGRAHV